MNPTIEQNKLFSTFQVAKICGVFPTTVINWVNKGILKAWHTPGGHRRIPLSELKPFMDRFQMPVPDDLARRRKRVLLVEDDPAVQPVLERALRRLPEAEVHVCADGLTALIEIGREAPDLLVLDIRIPQVDGLDVLRLLRANEHTRQVRILAVSGELLGDEEQEFVREMSDDYLRKPIRTEDFELAAAELLDLDSPSASGAAGARP